MTSIVGKSNSLITSEDNIAFENKKRFKRIRNSSIMNLNDIEIPLDKSKAFPLFTITNENFSLDDLIINNKILKKINLIMEENRNYDKFKFYGFRPKQKILLFGEPGTGKTFSAKVISSILRYPLITVTFDSIVSSYLGETASNLRKIFEFIRAGTWIVLFDEFDIISKKRDDPHEHGEIKRIVTNFMQMIDHYQGRSIIIAATNHQHLLDKAIWRRFEEVIEFPVPDKQSRVKLFLRYLSGFNVSNNIQLLELAERTDNFSGADISQICINTIKKCILLDESIITQSLLYQEISEQELRKNLIPP